MKRTRFFISRDVAVAVVVCSVCCLGGAAYFIAHDPPRLDMALIALLPLLLIVIFLHSYITLKVRRAEDSERRDLIKGLGGTPASPASDIDVPIRSEPDFFSKLIAINFTYIESYYSQTQEQANKSFLLSAFAAVVALAVIVAGIALMYHGNITHGVVATAAGTLSEIIASVFFYLYNRTVLKMGEYHQKLVITQNVALALKISEGLPESDKTKAQLELMRSLSRNINKYLSPIAHS